MDEPPRGQSIVRVQTGDAASAPWRVKTARRVLRALFHLLFRVRVIGLEHAPPGPAIICANHLGWADPFLLLLFLPVEPRIYVLGERVSVLRSDWRIRAINAFQVMLPLERDEPRAALRAMEDVLRRGGSVLIFPEGRLGEQEGTLQPLRPGAAHLSLRGGVPLLPVGLTGTRELWLRRRITMRIGTPINPSTVAPETPRSRATALTARLDCALRGLLPGDDARARLKPLRHALTSLL